MDKLLSLLLIASKAPSTPLTLTFIQAKDIAIQEALDEVLEYH
jgi:hypothetical protein